MPLCDLTCQKCHAKREHLLHKVPPVGVIVDDETCVDCGEPFTLVRDAAPAKTSFELKGQGWFRDGY